MPKAEGIAHRGVQADPLGSHSSTNDRVAALVPCFNEEAAIDRVVGRETHQGKGNVVRMFSEANIDVLVDGEATYDGPSARALIERLLQDRLDMVVAARVHHATAAYRAGHRTGNLLFTGFVASAFKTTLIGVLSGYRVFSRRFVKSFRVLSGGFRPRSCRPD